MRFSFISRNGLSYLLGNLPIIDGSNISFIGKDETFLRRRMGFVTRFKTLLSELVSTLFYDLQDSLQCFQDELDLYM